MGADNYEPPIKNPAAKRLPSATKESLNQRDREEREERLRQEAEEKKKKEE